LKGYVLHAALVLFLPAMVFATPLLTVQEAIKQALARNNLLKAATHERSAAGRETAAARSHYLPRLSLDETATVSNAPTRVFMMKLDEGRFTPGDLAIGNLNHPAAHGDFRTTLSLDQPLFDSAIARGRELAEKEEEGSGFALERRRQEVAYRVYCVCLEVQKAKGNLLAAEQAVADARERLRLAQVRGEAGVGLKSDELRARTFLAEMEQQGISARNDLALARLRLGQAVGGEPGETAGLGEELAPLPLALADEELRRLAQANRPELKELAAGLAKGEIAVRQARGAYLPTLYGTAAYQMNDRDIPFGRDNDAWQVGATLRWELFDGLRRGEVKGKAEALRSAAAEYLENGRKEVALQVEESMLRRWEAGKRLEVARHAVADAEEVVRLVSRRFENSLATFADLVDAQTALNRARAQLVGSGSDYALATARLYHATGSFLKEVMK
jgi:outer membrane protein